MLQLFLVLRDVLLAGEQPECPKNELSEQTVAAADYECPPMLTDHHCCCCIMQLLQH
jgi:hypothetical protein